MFCIRATSFAASGKLSHFRRKLLHRQPRVSGIQHSPDHAAAVRFVDQRVESVVAQQSFLAAKAYFDHLFENSAMAKTPRYFESMKKEE